tara:strand:- start:208 stop:1317 length:1110 start_codon:yes stop_codon:yes gene_type:complete
MAYTNIDDPSAHYQGLLYTGDSSSTTSSDRNLTNTGNSDLKPDFMWLFNRDTQLTGGQKIFDSTRGAGNGNSLSSSINNLPGYNDAAYGYVNSFNTDGFGVRAGTDSNRWFVDRGAGGGDKYVAFQWKANGGTTSTNSDGDIDSTVQVNSDAGFSIVKYTPSNTTARSIGHGLGAKPNFMIIRNYGRVEDWIVYTTGMGTTGGTILNSTAAYNSTTNYITGVTSSTFGVGTDFAVNGGYNYIAYCFTEKQGFSKFGTYYGNGNSKGSFVYTGHKPTWLLIRRIDTTGYHWRLYNGSVNPQNVVNRRLTPNLAEAEGYHATDMSIDFLSNGFKLRATNGHQINVNNGKYIFMSFAENPFVSSGGVPGTAR